MGFHPLIERTRVPRQQAVRQGSSAWPRVGAEALLAGLLLALAPAGRSAAAAAPATAAAPKIVLTNRSQDGGSVEEGTSLAFHFTVQNEGQADLQILDVKPSCGCTVPHWDKLIAPGKSGTIEAEVHTEHFRGAIQKSLLVISNDPHSREIELTLSGKVTPLVQISPTAVAMLSVDDKPVSQVLTLERTGGRPMKILQVSATPPYLKTELIPLPGPGRYRLTVTATPDAPLGRSTTGLILKTDLPKVPTQVVAVFVDRGIVTIPPSVYWIQPPPGPRPPMKAVVMVMRQQGSFHIKSVKADDPGLQVSLDTVRDGQMYQVGVTFKGDWTAGRASRTLTIDTDDPKQPELKIPVQAVAVNASATP